MVPCACGQSTFKAKSRSSPGARANQMAIGGTVGDRLVCAQTDGSRKQCTIANPISFKGRSAFGSEVAEITIEPADIDHGVRFQFKKEEINPKIEQVRPEYPHMIAIGARKPIFMIEHLLASLFGLEIDNAKIKVYGDGHIPFLDGSARPFVEKLLLTGIVDQEKEAATRTPDRQCLFSKQGDRFSIIANNNRSRCEIFAQIQFDDPIGKQELHYIQSRNNFINELSWARTFYTKPIRDESDFSKLMPGFRLHKNGDANMLVHNALTLITPLRGPDEHIRHKILDMIADISLLGHLPNASFMAFKPGHVLTRSLISQISEQKRP